MKEILFSWICLAGAVLLMTYVLWAFALWEMIPSYWDRDARTGYAITNGMWWFIITVLSVMGSQGNEE